MAIIFNLLVIYIMLFRFRLKGVDYLLSFILAIIDITYALTGILNFSLFVSASGKYHENRLYCIITRIIMDCVSTTGLNTVVVLAIVRYLAICKKFILSKHFALAILIIISSIPITGLLTFIYNSKPILNSKTSTCSFGVPFDSVYNKLLIWLNLYPFIYLVTITACYIPIMRYYSKMKIVLSECGSTSSVNSSIETSKDIQAYQSLNSQSENPQKPNKFSSLTNTYRFQKFLPILKIASIIIMYFVELMPYYSIQIYLSITNNTEQISELSVQITLLLADFIPLTNTFLILFIHEETWQELRLLGVVWGNWIIQSF
jgi:hypothetical protein